MFMKNYIRKNNRQVQIFRETALKVKAVLLTFERFTAGDFLLPLVAVFCLLFVASCGLITRNFAPANSSSNATDNSNAANANEAKSANYDKEKFQKLLDAGKEIEKMSLPVKINPKPTLKGKVFVFRNIEADITGGYRGNYDDGISSKRKADSLEELQTAIRINCRKGRFIGDFQSSSNGIETRAKGYGLECEVALIDYPARIIFDKKTFSNNENQELISTKKVSGGIYLNPPPLGDITRYINSLPVDKVAPELTSLYNYEKELIRLPTTVSLKPDAALKGKIAFARQYQVGDISQSPGWIDYYGDASSFFPSDKIANNTDQLETLVKIVCGKGDKIGQTGTTTQYANRCEISLIDYKTLTVTAQKIVENKTLVESAKDTDIKIYVTDFPKEEVNNYLKSLPTS